MHKDLSIAVVVANNEHESNVTVDRRSHRLKRSRLGIGDVVMQLVFSKKYEI